MTGDFSLCLLLLLLTFVFTAVLVLLIVKSKNNYYEDVLQTAETAQSAITAQKEGQLNEVVPKKVRMGKLGLGKGWGASAIYQKHAVENRRSGIFFLSNLSLIFVICIIAASFFMREFEEGAILSVFAMGTYMQIFSTALGRFNRELMKPYLYLIPEPPLKKLLYAIKESLWNDTLEAVIIFVPVAFIIGASPLDTVFCIAARISFSLLFTAGNVLVERVFGTVSSKVLIMFFYVLALLLMAAPGIILGAVLMTLAPLPGFMGLFLGIIVLNIPVSLLVLYLCRNLLQYAELNNR
ncbi:putative ABC exporter domain-containing protein [Neglectibacter caecimuris]|uniref:putative ABC exporter domain-containing protein n=1 Tax=Neglectibacter caecimuris TaxID=3093658 RepID=UPI002AC9CF98|nr:putative ABC exporter domain-containing protein [Neglectibacter sp. M00184]